MTPLPPKIVSPIQMAEERLNYSCNNLTQFTDSNPTSVDPNLILKIVEIQALQAIAAAILAMHPASLATQTHRPQQTKDSP